ncbi:MAG: DUF1385 domain-containing protein [Clostridia bacterium]|nr:DUF1385 domain-containing protein [Clostridia bacterium]
MADKVCKRTSIGGQALIEGVMMRGPEKTAMAVRHSSGEIRTKIWDTNTAKAPAFWRVPILRGLYNFVLSMKTGYGCMMESMTMSGMEEELDALDREEKVKKAAEKRAKAEGVEVTPELLEEEGAAYDAKLAAKKEKSGKSGNETLMNVVMVIGMVLGVVLAVTLFMLLPRLAVDGLEWLCKKPFNAVGRSGIEQLLKLAIMVLYMWLVSHMKDIRRVFQYHGAEHKSIFCYEKGLELTVENVRAQRRFHPRCGTSFLILMIIVSLVFSTLVQILFPGVYTVKWLWIVVKILLVPLTCGFGYELLKLCGRHDNWFTRVIAAPGLWVQRITTKEPEDAMIECAITSLKAVIPADASKDNW